MKRFSWFRFFTQVFVSLIRKLTAKFLSIYSLRSDFCVFVLRSLPFILSHFYFYSAFLILFAILSKHLFCLSFVFQLEQILTLEIFHLLEGGGDVNNYYPIEILSFPLAISDFSYFSLFFVIFLLVASITASLQFHVTLCHFNRFLPRSIVPLFLLFCYLFLLLFSHSFYPETINFHSN